MTERGRTSFIIVGGGASGVILAAHLLRSPNAALRVTIIEKRSAFGQGLAYSTYLPDHLLNVSAMGMSALADDREHFWRWIKSNGLATEEEAPVYAPRSIYGLYLQELLTQLYDREPDRLRLIQEEAIWVAPTSAGVDVRLANGTNILGHVAVLAAGHDEEPAPEQRYAMQIGSNDDTLIDPESRVLILGSGLSMVDAWLTLEHRGHRGEIVALSRRGLLPSPHRQGRPILLDSADIPLGTELSYFFRWFRNLIRATEAAGGNWRDAVDGLRPFNQLIWQSWPVSAKRRFLEHTKAWWDIHRHRMAPEIHARLSEAVGSGRLRLLAGRVLKVREAKGKFEVDIQRRPTQEIEHLCPSRIYDCTGIVKDVSTGAIAIVRSLTDRRLARPNSLRLGIDVTKDCAVIDADGVASATLFAIGPLTRGTFFEIDAVPDIRKQCASLAERLTNQSS